MILASAIKKEISRSAVNRSRRMLVSSAKKDRLMTLSFDGKNEKRYILKPFGVPDCTLTTYQETPQQTFQKFENEMSQTSFEEFYNPPSDYRVYRKPQPPRAYVLNVHRKKTMRAKSEPVFPGPLEEALIKKDVMTYRYLRGDQEFGGSLTSISQQA